MQWHQDVILLIQIITLTRIQALVMVAGAVVISTQTTSVRAANLLASFIIIPMAILVQGESLIMFWAQYNVLWWVILGLVLVTLVLVRMGVRLFNREELLGRDIDEINLKAGWRTFADASVYRLPLVAGSLGGVEANFNHNLAELSFVSAGGAAWVFFTNLRALVIATLLGIFSFGVLGVVLLMVPLALTGFFAGQVALIGLSPLQFFAAFILPHGVFEITAAVLEGAAILRLGASGISPPGGKTLSGGWLIAPAD